MGSRSNGVLVVTGGGSGIGLSVVEAALKESTRVVVLDLPPQCAALAERHPSVQSIACDVSDEAQVTNAFAHISSEFGITTKLFTSAGIDVGGLLHEMPFESWRRVQDVNVSGTVLACKYGVAQMLAASVRGSIVCCSSPAASVALAGGGTAAYSASKAAVSALVRCLAIDYAASGIRVNAVVPGATETPLMWANVAAPQRAPMREQLAREIPLGRLAAPSEVAAAVLWLLSEDSSYVTGAHLVCDGGILAKGSISV